MKLQGRTAIEAAPAADETGAIRPPDPLPQTLRRAIAAVARDRGLLENWMNTTVADQWRSGSASSGGAT